MVNNCARLTYILDLPPSVNHYYFTAKNGKRLMTDEAKGWMTAAQWLIKAVAREQGWVLSKGEKLVMGLRVFWPDNRRRDTHNLHKALCDAPEGIAYADDRCVLVRDLDFCVDKLTPRVEVEIWRAADEMGPSGKEVRLTP